MSDWNANSNVTGSCRYEGCSKPATVLVQGRQYNDDGELTPEAVGTYCVEHGKIVIETDNPEYWVECPHCQCHFGVG